MGSGLPSESLITAPLASVFITGESPGIGTNVDAATVAYNYFQRHIASLLSGTEALSNLVLAYVAGDARAPRAVPPLREAQGGVH